MVITDKDRNSKYDGMYFVHEATRRDIGNIIKALEVLQVKSNDPKASWHRAAITKYTYFFVECIHTHHTIEDEIFFPWIRSKGCIVPENLEPEHVEVHNCLENFKGYAKILDPLSGATDEQLVQALNEYKLEIAKFGGLLGGHLRIEEETVAKFFVEHTTKKEFEKECLPKILERGFKSGNLDMELAWMLSSHPERADLFLKEMPPPPRMLYKNFWKQRYFRDYGKLLENILFSDTPPKESAGCSCAVM